jgi:hypothetical protein
MGLRLPIQFSGNRRPRFAIQRPVSLTNEPLADSHDLPLAQSDLLGDLLVRQAARRMGFIR